MEPEKPSTPLAFIKSIATTKGCVTVNENNIKLIDIICEHLVEKALSSGQLATHKLIVSGREPTRVELFSGHLSNWDDL